jgi:TPR repeat protein
MSIDRRGKFYVGARAVGLALALGCVSVGGAAQHLSEGLRAYEAGHYRKAFQIIRSHALQGDPDASYHLSRFYRTGNGVKRDEYAAYEWCRRAAEQGVAQAQYRLGLMYMDGEGVTSDEYEAMKWLELAVKGGNEQARQVLDYVLYGDFTIGC